uniref:G-protein coupled receptors family 1 profile domain-containing protein n=1 Tax=Leptobrachium leishanense TaxID=445787 RepID=A0A8C5QAD1_9ANUR
MEKNNHSKVREFVFVGFPSTPLLQSLLFCIFLFIYILTLISNAVIIIVVRKVKQLHTPMYIFISALSVLEICYTTVTTPNLLLLFLTKMKTISFGGCMTQLYVFFSLGSSECLLLAVMAGDRYLAICNPLRYSSLMTSNFSLYLIFGCYLSGFTASIFTATFIASLPFCGLNLINHFFCDYPPLLKLSCTDTSTTEKVFFTLSWSIVLSTCLLTMGSYVCIVSTILRMPSSKGRGKAFSTCASHLTVVSLFYGTVIFMYVRPKAKYDLNTDKLVSMFYSVITPLLNPLIYSLRNQEVRKRTIMLYQFHCGFSSKQYFKVLKPQVSRRSANG